MEKQVILKGIFSDGNMTFIQGLGGISLIDEDWMKKNKERFDKKKSKKQLYENKHKYESPCD